MKERDCHVEDLLSEYCTDATRPSDRGSTFNSESMSPLPIAMLHTPEILEFIYMAQDQLRYETIRFEQREILRQDQPGFNAAWA